MNERTEGAPPVRCSAWLGDTCEYCDHWEPDTTGLRPYRMGYCPVFRKRTDAIHGTRCTAHKAIGPCPKCGCQTRDPFGSGKVIHDVGSCGGVKSPNDHKLSDRRADDKGGSHAR